MIALDQARAAPGSDKESFGEKAQRSFEKSIGQRPEFSGNYLRLGYLALYFQRPKDALQILDKAYVNKHYSPAILTYLGSLNASNRRFDEALDYLTESNTLSTRVDTLIVLGDVYRHKSDMFPQKSEEAQRSLRAAINRHKEALNMANRPDLVKGTDYDELLYTMMPNKPGEFDDLVSRPFSNLDHFKILINYCLSFDHILNDERDEAEAAFEKGFAEDKCFSNKKQFKYWYENQITYLLNERKNLSERSREWLKLKEEKFRSCK